MSIAVSLRLNQTDPVFLFRLSRRQGPFTLTGFPSIAGVWMKNPRYAGSMPGTGATTFLPSRRECRNTHHYTAHHPKPSQTGPSCCPDDTGHLTTRQRTAIAQPAIMIYLDRYSRCKKTVIKMALARQKFSSQADPELLEALREIAQQEGRQFQAVLEQAMREFIERKNSAHPRAHVIAHFRASMEQNDELYKLLAQ
jgi:predicted transcriptional regulator